MPDDDGAERFDIPAQTEPETGDKGSNTADDVFVEEAENHSEDLGEVQTSVLLRLRTRTVSGCCWMGV